MGRAWLIGVLALPCAVVAGCGAQDDSHVRAPSRAQARAELRGSPPALAALHGEGGRLLDGGASAFRGRLARLRGYPVVVNAWASWCEPCRREFPVLGAASAAIGRRVAFLGLNALDHSGDARGFLSAHPVSYPSYEDGDGNLVRSVNPSVGLPATVFYNRHGRLTYFHPGPYRSVAALIADVRRYAAGNGRLVVAKPSPAPRRFEGGLMPPGLHVHRFALTDQSGRLAAPGQYAGRPWLLTFMHSHCHGSCPLMAQQIDAAFDHIGRRIPVLAVSVEPQRDTPASAREFLRRTHMVGRMRFLLGPRRRLAPLWHSLGIAQVTPAHDHSAYVFLVDRRGIIRVGWPASHLTPEGLEHDLRALIAR